MAVRGEARGRRGDGETGVSISEPPDSEGQYGVRGLDVGVPVKAGRQGVEQIIEIGLTPEAQVAFQESAAAVRWSTR